MKIFWAIIYTIAVIFLIPFFYFLFDFAGNCTSDGKVWDYDLKQCRDDCLHWNSLKGCIKLSDEEIKEFRKCKGQPSTCYTPIYDKMFPKKCFDYNSAYNLDDGYCDFKFELKDCYKLEGNWQYPKACKK